ncbi:protein kinase [Lyngbya sp. PCC 8106]|uniref:protein kinase domain-containing protein n=1 Tax=Lyngbya sp. (strain PCC 8106) TaxID=313612 RepID=UPI0000EA9140|nr:protein kinase [Lyngbya sp. PCC 8106]EAW33695.1 serine/threonine protein kinase [Lyngbya sp. PCC 8106]
MSKNKKKPWNEKWETIEQIGGGGQGLTFLVKPKNDSFPTGNYVLKILKNQKSFERRSRMHIEVTALDVLNCPGIPKLIDSNSHLFKEDIPLYMVTEFIDGSTLYDLIASEIMDVFEGIKLTINLLKALEYCHQNSIVHRDIKPDNIIIKNDDIASPLLIDFGISFNKLDDNNTSLTPVGQELGNRFLHLPEHKQKSNLQRDPRSDITQICGILFFAITGKVPTQLFYEGSKPHQMKEAQQKLSALPEHILSKINRVFDRAFEGRIDFRWQSIPALRNALLDLLESENKKHKKTEVLLDCIKDKASSNLEKKIFQNLTQQILKKIYDVVSDLSKELGSEFGLVSSKLNEQKIIRPEIDWDDLTFFQPVLGITYQYGNQSFFPGFEGYITGNEVVLVSSFEHYRPKSKLDNFNLFGKNAPDSDKLDEQIELLRTPLNGEPDFSGFETRLKNFYLEGIKSMM